MADTDYALVVHHSVDIRDNPLLPRYFDRPHKVLFRAPFRTRGSLLVELSQIPDIVAALLVSYRQTQDRAMNGERHDAHISYPVPSLCMFISSRSYRIHVIGKRKR